MLALAEHIRARGTAPHRFPLSPGNEITQHREGDLDELLLRYLLPCLQGLCQGTFVDMETEPFERFLVHLSLKCRTGESSLGAKDVRSGEELSRALGVLCGRCHPGHFL